MPGTDRFMSGTGHADEPLTVRRSAVAAAGVAVEGVEDIGPHYATTLSRWRERLPTILDALVALGRARMVDGRGWVDAGR